MLVYLEGKSPCQVVDFPHFMDCDGLSWIFMDFPHLMGKSPCPTGIPMSGLPSESFRGSRSAAANAPAALPAALDARLHPAVTPRHDTSVCFIIMLCLHDTTEWNTMTM